MSIDYQQEYFLPGAVVHCTTCLGESVKGEVVAFERHKKLLILKSSITAGKQQVQFINLELVKEINIVREQTQQQALHSQQQQFLGSAHFNHNKIQRRKQEEIDRKRRSISSVNISPCGQKVFLAIRKTIEEVYWDGDSIVVFDKVIIRPPYRVVDVQTKTVSQKALEDDKAASHIRKIVGKALSNYTDKAKIAARVAPDKAQSDVLCSSSVDAHCKSISVADTVNDATAVNEKNEPDQQQNEPDQRKPRPAADAFNKELNSKKFGAVDRDENQKNQSFGNANATTDSQKLKSAAGTAATTTAK